MCRRHAPARGVFQPWTAERFVGLKDGRFTNPVAFLMGVNCPLHLGVISRSVPAREKDSGFGCEDLLVQQRLLLRFGQFSSFRRAIAPAVMS